MKVLLKRIPGQLKQVPIDEEETFLRQNFTESDNRNFRDGDIESTRLYEKGLDNDGGGNGKPETSKMYDAPVAKLEKQENEDQDVKLLDLKIKHLREHLL